VPSGNAADPFAYIRDATLEHRKQHGCGAYPYGNGPLLATLARAVGAKRILECGCALGYTALSFANSASRADIDTIERDPAHVKLARDNIFALGMESRIAVHEGDFEKVLPTLKDGYDLAFFDGHAPAPNLLAELRRLLRAGGTLVTANLNHGGSADAVCEALADRSQWLTSFIDQDRETAISVKL
jgi:predicted O-methyltransferase YrrM